MVQLRERDTNRVIEMAWEEQDVITLMRRELKPSSWRLWRKRVQSRKTKHSKLRSFKSGRHKCSRQNSISNNKISKR